MTSQELLFLTPEEVAVEIAKQIKEHRIHLGYKQVDFAKRMGIPYPTYQLFERTGKISFVRFLTILAAVGKKGLIFEGLEMEEVETLGIDAIRERNDKPKRQRVR